MQTEIQTRYANEAACCTGLSCGGALELAAPAPGEDLLDIGSGRGMDVLKAARLVGPEGSARGIDFTDAMLAVAEANRRKLRLDNASFLQGDMDALPLEDESVDVVISNCAINHAPDKAAVYREIFRVLKAGGRAVVSDIIAPRPLPAEVVADPDAWAGCYGGAIPRAEYTRAITGAGFGEPEVLELSQPYDKGPVQVQSITVKFYKNNGGER